MPRLIRLHAACKRPSRSRNAEHRAEPITVPLFEMTKMNERIKNLVNVNLQAFSIRTNSVFHYLPAVNYTADRGPIGLFNVFTAINHALIALSNEVYLLGMQNKYHLAIASLW